ncbi:MAG: hypothetical protein ACI9UR_001351 [Bacteroidia bacterium]|jgi:hypothetical protein
MKNRHFVALFILFCYTVTGLIIYDDYGISWDEPMQRSYGEVVINYVVEGDTALYSHNSRYHGPAFQMLLYSIEKLTASELGTYKIRHLGTFLFSVFGLWCFYHLLLLLHFKPHWSALGILFLIASPRVFAHSFYNSKDAVLMYMFIVCVYALVTFIQKPKISSAVILGLLAGILIDIRILGLFLPMFLIAVWGLRTVESLDYGKRTFHLVLLSGLITVVVMIVFWPTLWRNPVIEFGNALAKMGDYPWDDPVLFAGSFALPKDLPWYYLPKWMFISTPLVLSGFAVVGVFGLGLKKETSIWEKAIPFIWLLPLLIIVAKGATVYDGWRHVFFLYPAIVILAVSGAEMTFGRWRSMPFLKWVPAALMLIPLSYIIRSHPHQQVYFNATVSKNAWRNYEMDYWGLSYKQGLEYVCALEPKGRLKLSVANGPGFYNHYQLGKTDQERIDWVSRDSADFFISNFRFPKAFEAFANNSGAYHTPLKIIEVDGNPILGVFDLRN